VGTLQQLPLVRRPVPMQYSKGTGGGSCQRLPPPPGTTIGRESVAVQHSEVVQWARANGCTWVQRFTLPSVKPPQKERPWES
jgi:hypothetical protein